MENKEQLLLISDIHLEARNEASKEVLLKACNNKINTIKNNGKIPILLASGDISEGLSGLDFLNKLDCQVFYTFGNHEYWRNDYFELNKKINNQKVYKNVTVLLNDFAITEENIILGTTLWSDLGEYRVPKLLPELSNTMNDEHRITAVDWYTESNIEKIDLFYKNNNLYGREEKTWNVLIEKEENKKSTEFINDFINDYDLLAREKLTENKFNLTKDLLNKKLIVMSHHLPFIEEIEINSINMNKDLKNNNINYYWMINNDWERTNQESSWYIRNCSKGEIEDCNSFIHTLNYCNDGHNNFSKNIYKYVNMWVHGHNHNEQYQDYLKGIPIGSNTIGHRYDYINKSEENKFKDILLPLRINKTNTFSEILEDIINNKKDLIFNEDFKKLLDTNIKIINKLIKSYMDLKNPLNLLFLEFKHNYYIKLLNEKLIDINESLSIRVTNNYNYQHKTMKKQSHKISEFLYKTKYFHIDVQEVILHEEKDIIPNYVSYNINTILNNEINLKHIKKIIDNKVTKETTREDFSNQTTEKKKLYYAIENQRDNKKHLDF